MKATFKNIITDFENFCDNHNQINEFTWGPLTNISTKEQDFILVHCLPAPSQYIGREVILSFEVLILDIVKQDKTNFKDVMNDNLLIGLDIVANFFDDEDTYDWTLDEDSVLIRPFFEEFDDYCAGYVFEINISIENRLNTCDIPENLT